MTTTDGVVPSAITEQKQRDSSESITRVLPLLADIARADVLFCVLDSPTLTVVAHSRPHSIAPVHRVDKTGEAVIKSSNPMLLAACEQNRHMHTLLAHGDGEGAPILQEAFPVRIEESSLLGVLVVETNLLESERLRRRSKVFQRALRNLKWMATVGQPHCGQNATPFGEYDGLLYADTSCIIQYMSGIATNLYRNIGYTESLIGKPLLYLETVDSGLAVEALKSGLCIERDIEEKGRYWTKKAIPIMERNPLRFLGQMQLRPMGVLLAIHDATEARQRESELKIKSTMIKEVHHRVKNDLQTVAALLRMQARRMETDEARAALSEAVNRILSIAVIHEFLSDQDSRIINIREMAQRILNQMQSGLIEPGDNIDLKLKGPNLYMPARQATSCALVINELLQNALEHGFDQRTDNGSISLLFEDEGDQIVLKVHDDGRGLPSDFDLERVDSLGLRIVRTLVNEDLKGQIQMQSDHGVSAIVRFPKIPLGGEDSWNEHG